jgi:hypothetical protein
MMMKKPIYWAMFTALCSACQKPSPQAQNNSNQQHPYCIIGKKAKIIFPNMTAEVNYPNDSTLHWKTTNPKGETNEGIEHMKYHKIDQHLHFLNWIEKDGFTVSQIINTQTGQVKAYWSFADEKSDTGQRSANFIDGRFQYLP